MTPMKNENGEGQKYQEMGTALEKNSQNNTITCGSVHKVAKEYALSPLEAGKTADRKKLKFTECQLGLFGWLPYGKILDKTIDTEKNLETKIEQAAENGKISCLKCWNIAKDLKIKRLDVGSACEKKQIKIVDCQIGAF